MKKFKVLLGLFALLLMISGCSPQVAQAPSEGNSTSESQEENVESNETQSDITIEQVNDFLNNSAGLGPGGIGNAVAVVPHAHIDGPRNETPFYAFVNFKYRARDYIKYQVTYLSCTCRETSVNIWQTMYVELTLPSSKDPNEVQVKYLSFDQDSTGNYLGGFWGDSDPGPGGQTYDMFKTEFIPYFVNKDAAHIKSLSVMEDITPQDYTQGEGREGYTIDTFSGASVSTNNIIRILHSVIDYHQSDEFFSES